MSMTLGGTNPAVTFPDGTIQNSAFNGTSLSASPYTTSLGANTLVNNSGTANTAVGNGALQANTTASNNTAVGYQAGYSNTTGQYNVFVGWSSGLNATGTSNVGVGNQAAKAATGSYNTCIGDGSGLQITSGSYNTILGAYQGNSGGLDIRTASNYIVLSDGAGNPRGYFDGSTFYCTGIYNTTTSNGANVYVYSNGALARSTSALKYKQDIRDLESIDVNKFRPVRYKSKCEKDDQTKDHFGIIADEVDAAGIKELVQYGENGEIEGFSYERLTVVLVKAIQELNAKVTALEAQLGAK